MYTSNLRKVGGSIMLAVPPALLEMLQLASGSTVSMAVESGRLVIEPEVKKSYTLKELLDQCDLSSPMTDEDKEWLTSPAKGKELI